MKALQRLKLSKAEQKALDREINRQLAQNVEDLYTGADTDYMCKRKLKDLGIDVEQLPEVLAMEYEVK